MTFCNLYAHICQWYSRWKWSGSAENLAKSSPPPMMSLSLKLNPSWPHPTIRITIASLASAGLTLLSSRSTAAPFRRLPASLLLSRMASRPKQLANNTNKIWNQLDRYLFPWAPSPPAQLLVACCTQRYHCTSSRILILVPFPTPLRLALLQLPLLLFLPDA